MIALFYRYVSFHRPPHRPGLILLFLLSAFSGYSQPAGIDRLDAAIARYEERGQTDSLSAAYLRKAALYRQQDDLENWLYCFWDLQAARFADSDTALFWLDRAVTDAWRPAAAPSEQEAWLWVQVNRGYHLFQLGKVLAATRAYEAAWRIYRDEPPADFPAVDYLFLPLGAHYTRLGDNERARALYRQAIRTTREPAALGGLYNNLGLTWWNAGDNTAAIREFRRGLAVAGLPAAKRNLLRISLARSYYEEGRIDTAVTLVDRAIRELSVRPAGADDAVERQDYLSGAYLLRGVIAGARRQYSAAGEALDRALALRAASLGTTRHREVAKIQVEQGKLALARGDYRAAVAAFDAALTGLLPGFRPRRPADLPAAGRLYEENTLFEALDGKADALWGLSPDTLGAAAFACHRLGAEVERRLRATFLYESSKLLLQARSRSRLEKALVIAHQLYRRSRDDSYLRQAWELAEGGKAAVLLDAMRENALKRAIGAGDTLLAAEARLRKQIAFFDKEFLLAEAPARRQAWQEQRAAAREALAALGERLRARYPAYARLSDPAFRPLDYLAGDMVRPGMAVVEFVAGPDAIHTFCRMPGGALTWRLLSWNDSLQARAAGFLNQFSERRAMATVADYQRQAYALYRHLLDSLPAFREESVGEVIIVPDGWLSFLPFEALVERPGEGRHWEQLPYVLRGREIHYAFSLGVLSRQAVAPPPAPELLLKVAPVFPGGERGLTPLLASADEIAGIGGGRRLWQAAAAWAPFARQAGRYRVLHLSTHARADGAGEPPSIEFWDQPVYLPEIYALDLRAGLVVLSACQTAMGEWREGEGVMSLSRAFTYAGAGSLVSSLWTVNEAATARLIAAFYDGLRSGRSRGEALRQAKLTYLGDPAVAAFQKSPYYWAGYVYLGPNDPIDLTAPSRPRRPLAVLAGLLLALAAAWWLRKRLTVDGEKHGV